jgi:hypothetical protein
MFDLKPYFSYYIWILFGSFSWFFFAEIDEAEYLGFNRFSGKRLGFVFPVLTETGMTGPDAELFINDAQLFNLLA